MQRPQMRLRKGMAILLYYVVGNTQYQAVLIAEDSVVNRGGKGENRLWKRVIPTVTEFAWLPPNIAESFWETARTYHAFDIPHLELDTSRFVADVRVFFLLYAAWVRSRAERPSVSYTKVVSNVAWTGHNLQFTKTN